jgi:cadmium resistance protein CadD (predicted permease)
MARDWWWPWWISTAIDLVIALAALVVLVRARGRVWRIAAGFVMCVAVVAAALAPVVMSHSDDDQPSPSMDMGRMVP